jgi:hypothetical protein
MTQPLGNCPGCGGDEPFEQIHAGGQCPDSPDGCQEWTCVGCGAGVFLGIIVISADAETSASARQSVRAA